MESASTLMDEIRERLQLIESLRPKNLDAMDVSQTAKIPWKSVFYRGTLIWRMAELSRSAVENFDKDRLVSAIVLTRAAAETFAVLWYLWHKIAAALESNSVGDIDTDLMSLISGTRIPNDPDFPQAVHILKVIDKVSKEIEGFRHQYDVLCEYTHPNASGTTYTYLKHNKELLTTDFGPNASRTDGTRLIGLVNLSVSLMMFEHKCNRIEELMPSFTTLCENELKQRASANSGS